MSDRRSLDRGRETARAADSVAPDFLGAAERVVLTRRALIKYSSILGLLGFIELKRPGRTLDRLQKLLADQTAPTVTTTVTRPDDMMSLTFQCVNFQLQGPPAKLTRLGTPAFLVVEFEPQSIGEQVFDEPGASLPSAPIKARLSGKSRLAFLVPASISSIPFQLDQLLDWGQLQPSVVGVCQIPPENQVFIPDIFPPSETQTSLEVPWNLILSPTQSDSGWDHATDPVAHGARTELWHTRLGLGPGRHLVGERPQMRAVWMDGFDRHSEPNANPFEQDIASEQRREIILLTSDFRTQGYKPRPVSVNNFMLSALGAWMDITADWSQPENYPADVIHWDHRMTMGRDQHVRVVTRGFLFPFGHPAVRIEVTEREFWNADSGAQKGKIGGYLRKHNFIVVKQPIKAYSRRDLPFKEIRIATLQTPDLDPPKQTKIIPDPKDAEEPLAFWPFVDGKDFPFHIVATDQDDQEVEFTCPLAFIVGTAALEPPKVDKLIANYASLGSLLRRYRHMNGQKIAFAPSSPDKLGGAALITDVLIFQGDKKGAPFSVKLDFATVKLQAVDEIKGKPVGPTNVVYPDAYIANGFEGANADPQMFLKLLKPLGLDYGASNSADRSGGFATPNMKIGGLSRVIGPIGGEQKGATPPSFDPKTFFDKASILGGISLADIINAAGIGGFGDAPKLTSHKVYPGGNTALPPTQIVTELTWHLDHTQLKPDGAQLFEPFGDSTFDLNATFITPVDPPGEPTYEITGSIRHFTIHMIGKPNEFLALEFSKVTFTAKKGHKTDVDVDITNVEFAGVLSFVNALKDFLKSNGTGFSIDVTPTQVAAGYTLALPDIAVGVFSLTNISLSAGVTIPFSGDPVSAKFGFAKRDAPFLITYTIFGGGGFFQITIGKDPDSGSFGMELLEASLEFGGAASIDIGVASGGVHIMAGIYFKIGKVEGCDRSIAQLTGYVRLGGELEVLGIISISLEFKVSMTYDFDSGDLWGQATLTVEIDVAFFSTSVDLTVEKRFAGNGEGGAGCAPKAMAASNGRVLAAATPSPSPSPGSPEAISFVQLITEDEWKSQYIPAFAPEAFAA